VQHSRIFAPWADLIGLEVPITLPPQLPVRGREVLLTLSDT